MGIYPRPNKQCTALFVAHCDGPGCSLPHAAIQKSSAPAGYAGALLFWSG